MTPSIYLINPMPDFPTYWGAEVYAARGLRPAALMADLAILTLAAMVPRDFHVSVCDEAISPVDFDTSAPFVGITGKVNQWGRMRAIADEFRRRGKVVIIGGPFASLSPDVVRPHCDILVRNEIEDMAADLFAALRDGSWAAEYVGGRPDLSRCPPPRWDLYPNDHAMLGSVQTSRGCPFECEFCDVIQYLGRRQRHKPVAQVLSELDDVFRHGYRSVFVADDNFTAYRSRAKELLAALRSWNAQDGGRHMRFGTQVSIDAARDDELLTMSADAGLTHVFIGIETPNEESLRETKKRQNAGVDLLEQVGHFLDHGIAVTAGMIVGFDSDGVDIFECQYRFAMASPIPIFTLGSLVAPAATPLHARLLAEGRLVADGSEVAAMPWSTNLVPRRMSREQLLTGIRRLCNRLYEPAAFAERVCRFIDQMQLRPTAKVAGAPDGLRAVERDSLALLSSLGRLGPAEAAMWSRIRTKLARKPQAAEFVMRFLLQYLQTRHMYAQGRFWDADPAGGSAPSGAPERDLAEAM